MLTKIVRILFISLITTTLAFAQKPAAGKWSTEVIFNPFPSSISLNQINGGIKFRKFLKEKTALRLGAGFGAGSTTEKFSNPINDNEDGERKNSGINVIFMPGLEFHFSGTEKLSPYFGFDLGAGYISTTEKLININEGNNYREDYGRERTQSAMSYAFNLVLGADYYIAQNLFLGAEFGLRATNYMSLDTKTTYTGTAVAPSNTPRNYTSSSLNINTLAVSGFRLGIVF